MNHSLKTRVLALIMAVVMLVGLVPMSAFATETDAGNTILETSEEETIEVSEEVVEEDTEEVVEEDTEEVVEEDTEEVVEEDTEEVVEEDTEEVVEEDTEEVVEETVSTESVKYTVAHYLWDWDINDYLLLETEELTGVPGELTNAQEKAYEGRILEKDIEQVEILEDGTAVVNVYYIELLEEAVPFEETAIYDTSVSGEYFKVISADTYDLAPGAVEHEIVLNNAEGNDRKVVHVFEVDTKNEDLEVLPGYYAIDKLDPENLPLEGIADKAQYWKAEQLSKTVAYYEDVLGYNVVGAMNTALAYDSDAPYGYMVWDGVVLGTPEVHKGAQTYLAIDWDGNCELRSMSEPLTGNEKTAISANFGWEVKDGKLTKTAVERTSSDASRSIIGIKADGTLVFCLVDGRNAPLSSGLSNYEIGEMMLALGCVNAVNCDGGGSSTFISKRAGESENTMRSVPSDGSERATINSVILVSTAGASNIFNKALIETDYNYIAPTASMAISVTGLDTKNFEMEIPADVTYRIAEEGMGTIENGVYTAGNTTGTATIEAVYNGAVVGTKVLNVVHPEKFGFSADETVLPYGKSMKLDVTTAYGADSWLVCVDGAFVFTLSDNNAAQLDGNKLIATSDETVKGVDVTVTYKPDTTKTHVLKVEYGKGSEIIFNFEDGDRSGFMGFQEAKQWSIDNGVKNSLVGNDPLAGQFSEQVSGKTSVASAATGGQVKNGEYSLAWTVDNTDAGFAGWTYNVLFNTNEPIVLRDVANGKNATTLGMWLYVPEGAAGLAFQSQLYAKNADGTLTCKQEHFMFETVSGVRKNLNSCTEADIPASRWVYASINLTGYDYIQTPDPKDESNSRSPSIIRTYIKPTAPHLLTFYIDDITLDYSSAVDDRVAPTITKVEYSSADTAVALTDGTTIKANAAAFSAKVNDAGSLDLETAQIYLDGTKVETQVINDVMSTTDSVTMGNGTHKVTYEIADDLGNYTQHSVTFTVEYSEERGLVYMDGHNDSGEKPEYDSVYYIDIKTTDISKVETVEANIKLNTANTWELEHMTVAEGFEVEWEIFEADNTITTFAENTDIHSTENVAVIIITKTGSTSLTGEQTLVSLPVRLWSWNGFDSVNNKPVTPEEQFATGYCPIVTVDYEVLFGYAETTDGESISFNGSGSVETMINDTVNPWHYHDKELSVLNKAATCTVNGYENRTYCETCKSVIDWGTKIEAKGHTYAIKDGILHCGCGALFTGVWSENGKTYVNGVQISNGWLEEAYYRDGVKLTGVQKVPAPDSVDEFYYDFGENGVCVGKTKFTGVFLDADAQVYRYAQLGVLATGWQLIDEDWHYFDPSTNAAAAGSYKVGTITYEFEQTGKLTSGVWVNTLHGGRYYYGPGYHKAGWQTIDEKDYFFMDGYRLENGWHMVHENRVNRNWYFFEEDGVCLDKTRKPEDGLYHYNNKLTACLNGISPSGLVELDGKFYFFDHNGYAQNNGTYAGRLFLEDYAAHTGFLQKNDVTYYYVNGITATRGLYKIEEEYYIIGWGGEMKHSGSQYVSVSFCDLPAGTYQLDTDGKLMHGIVEVDDSKMLYINGKTATHGLYQVDGKYYYSYWGGILKTDGRYYVPNTYCDLPAGNYTFDVDGQMSDGIVEIDDVKYLFVNGSTATCGLYEVDGEYYYSYWGGVLMTDGRYYVQNSYCDLPGKTNYSFDAEGKMLNGIEEVDGTLYLYQNGTTATCGLFELDGEYYYSYWGGVLKTNGRYYVSRTYCDLPVGNYSFDAEGKMFNGVEEVNGTLYLYQNGTTATCGLFELDGEYYYSYWGGVLKTDGRYYVSRTYCDLPVGNYSFDAEGKMFNGVEEIDGSLYLYKNGTTESYGLFEVDGAYYFIDWGGVMRTDGRYYVSRTYCDLPAGNYTFGADGKMLDGFVTKDDGIYYYVDGNTPAPGLIYQDGHYYYVNWGGKLVTNQTFYVSNTNGYTIPMNYTFDEFGRLVR